MGAKELERKIVSDAEEEIKKIEDYASYEIDEINSRFSEERSGEKKRILAEAERKAELLRRELAGGARTSARVKVLEFKRRLLDDFFAEVHERVLGLPDSHKRKVMAKLVYDAESLDGDVYVYASDEYKKLVPAGLKVKVGDFTDFGVVLETSDGLRRVDNRLSVVLARLRGEFEHKLNKVFWQG